MQSREQGGRPPMEFQEYHGWVNYPTWSVYTLMTSFDEPREQLERMSRQQPGGLGNVRRAVLGSMQHWQEDKPTPYAEAIRSLAQSFLMDGVRHIAWFPLVEALQGQEQALSE